MVCKVNIAIIEDPINYYSQYICIKIIDQYTFRNCFLKMTTTWKENYLENVVF